jgi:hypothetical protein
VSRGVCHFCDSRRIFELYHYPIIDERNPHHDYEIMAPGKSTTRKFARAVAAIGAACFFLQIFAFMFSANKRIALPDGAAGVGIMLAGEFCNAGSHESGDLPGQHSRHHHCALCVAGSRDVSHYEAAAVIATVVVLALPQSHDRPAWIRRDELTPSPIGWTSSWSSRAPPSFS